jgi:hypothetical protein
MPGVVFDATYWCIDRVVSGGTAAKRSRERKRDTVCIESHLRRTSIDRIASIAPI